MGFRDIRLHRLEILFLRNANADRLKPVLREDCPAWSLSFGTEFPPVLFKAARPVESKSSTSLISRQSGMI